MQEKILNYLIKLCSYFYENFNNHLSMQKEAGQESRRVYFADVLNSSMNRKKKKKIT